MPSDSMSWIRFNDTNNLCSSCNRPTIHLNTNTTWSISEVLLLSYGVNIQQLQCHHLWPNKWLCHVEGTVLTLHFYRVHKKHHESGRKDERISMLWSWNNIYHPFHTVHPWHDHRHRTILTYFRTISKWFCHYRYRRTKLWCFNNQ